MKWQLILTRSSKGLCLNIEATLNKCYKRHFKNLQEYIEFITYQGTIHRKQGMMNLISIIMMLDIISRKESTK